MVESKKCPQCGETKPASEFSKDRSRLDGLQSKCSACELAYKRKYARDRPFYPCLHRARNRAKNRGVPFNITEEYLESIWTGVCPVFHVRLDLPSRGEGHKFTTTTPSLDRIAPDKGYVPGNVIWISLRANRMKNDGTSEELFRVAEWLQQTEEEIKRHAETD